LFPVPASKSKKKSKKKESKKKSSSKKGSKSSTKKEHVDSPSSDSRFYAAEGTPNISPLSAGSNQSPMKKQEFESPSSNSNSKNSNSASRNTPTRAFLSPGKRERASVHSLPSVPELNSAPSPPQQSSLHPARALDGSSNRISPMSSSNGDDDDDDDGRDFPDNSALSMNHDASRISPTGANIRSSTVTPPRVETPTKPSYFDDGIRVTKVNSDDSVRSSSSAYNDGIRVSSPVYNDGIRVSSSVYDDGIRVSAPYSYTNNNNDSRAPASTYYNYNNSGIRPTPPVYDDGIRVTSPSYDDGIRVSSFDDGIRVSAPYNNNNANGFSPVSPQSNRNALGSKPTYVAPSRPNEMSTLPVTNNYATPLQRTQPGRTASSSSQGLYPKSSSSVVSTSKDAGTSSVTSVCSEESPTLQMNSKSRPFNHRGSLSSTSSDQSRLANLPYRQDRNKLSGVAGQSERALGSASPSRRVGFASAQSERRIPTSGRSRPMMTRSGTASRHLDRNRSVMMREKSRYLGPKKKKRPTDREILERKVLERAFHLPGYNWM
jgi:hypothetical protein